MLVLVLAGNEKKKVFQPVLNKSGILGQILEDCNAAAVVVKIQTRVVKTQTKKLMMTRLQYHVNLLT